jgi:hypothetical protein
MSDLFFKTKLFIEKTYRPLTEQETESLTEYIEENNQYLEPGLNVQQRAVILTIEYCNFNKIRKADHLIPYIFKEEMKKAYLSLDSRYAQFNPACTEMQWVVSYCQQDKQNAALMNTPIKNVKRVRCASIVTRNYTTALERASIFIKEFSAQSFILPNGRRFHFLAAPNYLQNPINVSDRSFKEADYYYVADYTMYKKCELLLGHKFNDGVYNFDKPVTTLNTITMSIADPFTPLVIPKYEYYNAAIDQYGTVNNVGGVMDIDPVTGVLTAYTRYTGTYFKITFTEPHNLTAVNLYGNYSSTTGFPYSIYIDDVALNAHEPTGTTYGSTFSSLLTGREWNGVFVIDTYTLGVHISDVATYKPGKHLASAYTSITTNYPLAMPITARVRINSFRVIVNLEVEYTD